MTQDDLVKAIKFIRPNAEFVIRDEEIEWHDTNQTQPTESEIAQGWLGYQAKLEADKVEAEAKRQAAEAKLAALGLTSEDLKALGLAQSL